MFLARVLYLPISVFHMPNMAHLDKHSSVQPFECTIWISKYFSTFDLAHANNKLHDGDLKNRL